MDNTKFIKIKENNKMLLNLSFCFEIQERKKHYLKNVSWSPYMIPCINSDAGSNLILPLHKYIFCYLSIEIEKASNISEERTS